MKKFTHSTKRKRKAAIKRRYYRLKFLRNTRNEAVDRISALPDDALVCVLSRLSLKEAIATSILSTRWRHLYTRIHRLYIPTIKLAHNQEDFSKYVDTINHTLNLFSGNVALKEFGLNMHHCFEGANLERWLEFALAREVEKIYISICYDTDAYHYTLQLSNLIRGGRTLPGLRCLKELFLCGIKVEDPEVELLLSNFPLLESLSIGNSERLKNVSVRQGLKLKKLSMCSLRNLESIEIRDMINLVSFTYYGYGTYALRLTNVPKLTEFHIFENGVNLLSAIPSSIRDQLRLLEIYADPTLLIIQPSYELKNLKRLDLKAVMILSYSNHQLQKLFPLIEACTSLETLDVEFKWIDREEEEKLEIEEVDILPTRKQLSPNLKRFVLSGYTGSTEELNLASFVMNNAAALEQMIVEPCDENPTKERTAIARAQKQLRPIARSSLNLVIDPLA